MRQPVPDPGHHYSFSHLDYCALHFLSMYPIGDDFLESILSLFLSVTESGSEPHPVFGSPATGRHPFWYIVGHDANNFAGPDFWGQKTIGY